MESASGLYFWEAASQVIEHVGRESWQLFLNVGEERSRHSSGHRPGFFWALSHFMGRDYGW
jgi:hypothetical protein